MGTPAWSAEPEPGTKLHDGQSQTEGERARREEGGLERGETRGEKLCETNRSERGGKGKKKTDLQAGWTVGQMTGCSMKAQKGKGRQEEKGEHGDYGLEKN